jgi:holo-[acyl-carrier protein] synthase
LKVACGTDIIEIDRIKNAIERNGDKFLNTIYTDREIEYCESHSNNRYQHYAARFAAKEAMYKALSKISSDETVDWKRF